MKPVSVLVDHAPRQRPGWCMCRTPQPATAYGFAYCGRCWLGFEPKGER